MKTQSFEGFLVQYCQELTEFTTRSIKKFFLAACEGSSRVAEPLMLLALCQGREKYLMNLSSGTSYEEGYTIFLNSYQKSNMPIETFLESSLASERYTKVYRSYQSSAEELARDREMLEHLVPQVNMLLENQGKNRYQLTKELDINKGNLYAFLKGDVSKLSRDTAMGIYRHLLGISS